MPKTITQPDRSAKQRAAVEESLVGTDGSETARRAVRHPVDLARSLQARLIVASAYEPVPEARLKRERRETPDDLQWTINPRERVEAILAEAESIAKEQGVPVETEARAGRPDTVLLDVAEERQVDLIAAGNKGMVGARRFISSVPNHVSHHARCGVLIVPTTS